MIIMILCAAAVSAWGGSDLPALKRVWSFDWRPCPAVASEREAGEFRLVAIPVSDAAIRRPEGEFGAARRSGISYHKGTDFVARALSPVKAAADGFICYNDINGGHDSGYGYTVIIDHLNNFYTLYAHLNEISPLPPGTRVKAGQQIGRVGRSGNASRVPPEFQYHLHFEVMHAPSGLMNLGGIKITELFSLKCVTTLRLIGEEVYGLYWGGALDPEELGEVECGG